MKNLNRRSFLQTAGVATAALSFSARSWAQVNGSNSDIRVGVVGIKGRGQNHISELQKLKGVRVVSLCDVDKGVLTGKDGKVENAEHFTDIRRMLESKDLDAVSIATPNHWHALGTIWAIQAGKDVLVEKPVSHNVSEGRRMVEFARKHKKIVQTGTQSRSSITGIQAAVDWVNAGNLGKIKVARGYCYKPRPSIGKVDGPQPIPANIDYDLWSGPAEKLPLTRKQLHYDWHWVWNTGNGDLGNQGIHQMDIARWFLGEMELSPRIISLGGRLGYVDDGETPNTEIVYHDYAKAPLIFEVRGLPSKKGAKEMDKIKGSAGVSVVIECENGYVYVPSYSKVVAFDNKDNKLKEWSGAESHHANFIKAVQSRDYKDLHADILEGHLSSALCHTGNISYQLGTKKAPGQIREELKGNKVLSESFERMAAHLAANEVDIDVEKVALGVPLEMDPKTERFTNNDAANAMLTRKYRPGYVVPAKA